MFESFESVTADGDNRGPMVNGGLDRIAELVSSSLPERGRVAIAIDGVGASGKTQFADALAGRLGDRPVIVLHGDDFFHPSKIRYARGRYSPEGFWLDAFNYESLARDALEPFRLTGTYRPGSFDRTNDRTITLEARRAPADALLLVEGVFLHRAELAAGWDLSLFLDVSPDVAAQRMRARDAGVDAAALERYQGAQQIYFHEARPWEHATFVVDNTDFHSPIVVAASLASAAQNRA